MKGIKRGLPKFKKVIIIIAVVLAVLAIVAGSVYFVVRGNVKDGADGIGIKSIKLHGTDENGANVYTITLTDGTVYQFVAPQGRPGVNGTDGKDGETPHIGSNGNWFIGDVDTGVKAEGKDGMNGKNGKDGVLPEIGCVASGSGVFGYGSDGETCCIGYAQYYRTGTNSGYLNLSISLLNQTDASWFQYINLNCISDVIGVKLNQPSSLPNGRATGYWSPISTACDLSQASEYGATCVYDTHNYICLSRIYKTDTFQSGAWGLNFLAPYSPEDKWYTYTLTGIAVEETTV